MKPIEISKEWLEAKCDLGLYNQEIVELLKKEKNISCSAKTIAKYRKKFGINTIY